MIPFLFLFLFHTAVAQYSNRSTYPTCAYLKQGIYCVGPFNYDESQFISVTMKSTESDTGIGMGFTWTERTPFGLESNLDYRWASQSSISADRTKWIIHGGQTTILNQISHPFVIYDGTTDRWTSLTDYKQNLTDYHVINSGAVSYVKSLERFIFYGGRPNSQSTDNTTNPILGHGFTQLTAYDTKTQKWENSVNHTHETLYTYEMNSVYVEHQDRLYFIGGKTEDLNGTVHDHPYQVQTVQFPDVLWSTMNCTGDLPSPNNFTTSTLLSNNQFVLHCGEFALETDICFLLDLESMHWTRLNLTISSFPRRHSAILVDSYVLLFSLLHRAPLILNATDPYNVHIIEGFLVQGNEPIETKKSIGVIIIICLLAVLTVVGACYCLMKPHTHFHFHHGTHGHEAHEGHEGHTTHGIYSIHGIRGIHILHGTHGTHEAQGAPRPQEVQEHRADPDNSSLKTLVNA
ncbi:hypothetical protein BDB01DRAFT_807186 [Pilobolus umbonatus]|nr:hypothetical protein BDB01DRAFT_807186 [Pilobolus umbonatus]